jgi:hypothetical protein
MCGKWPFLAIFCDSISWGAAAPQTPDTACGTSLGGCSLPDPSQHGFPQPTKSSSILGDP